MSTPSVDELKRIACTKVSESSTVLHHVSQQLWENPELALQENFAHQLLTDTMEQLGFAVTRHYVLSTGFKATYSNGGDRPHVAVMCEFDALPEIGHACGHNLIAEAAVGAGVGVKAALDAGMIGKVTVLGTPAEEAYGGKIDMIKAGFFDDVDVAMMVHPDRMTTPHTPHLSMCTLRVTFTGKASHAAGAPWEGVNALDAAVTAYQSVSNLRQQMRPDWRVHGIVVEGGQKPNIIPDRAVLEYSVRCPTDKELSQFRAKVEKCFTAGAAAAGCECQIEDTEPAYSNIIPNQPLLQTYIKCIDALGIEHEEFFEPTGSTDMGNVSYVVPSIHPMFAIGTQASPHSHEFTKFTGAAVAQDCTIAQCKAMAMTSIEIMTNDGLLAKCKDSFRTDLAECKDA